MWISIKFEEHAWNTVEKRLASKLHGIYSALNGNLSFGLNWVHPSILLSAPGNVAPIKASFSAAFCSVFDIVWGGDGEVANSSIDPTGSTSFVTLPRNHR